MIVLDLSILNQKGTPMFNSDTFANRPAFGIVGRIFISIDTAAIYRDTGTAWDLIADGGSASTNIYNSNGTLSANRVVSDGGFGLSFTPTTHIGTAAIGGGGNGKLIVGSSTADNGIQVFGANAPSIRIDNAQSGGTQRFVFGLATATNNFIQGAAAGQFCISTQSAGNMLFGMWQTTNASEVMRITTTNNLLIGTTTDNGRKLQINGDASFATNGLFGGSNNPGNAGSFTISVGVPGTTAGGLQLWAATNQTSSLQFGDGTASADNYRGYVQYNHSTDNLILGTTSVDRFTITSTGNILISTFTDLGYKLQVNGTGFFSTLLVNNNGEAVRVFGTSPNISFYNSSNTTRGGYINHDGNMNIVCNVGKIIFSTNINMFGLPTSSAGLSAGDIWNNSGVLNIV